MVFRAVKIKIPAAFAAVIVLLSAGLLGLQITNKGTVRYGLLLLTVLYAAGLAAGALTLRFFCPRWWRRIFRCAVIILCVFSIGKLLHLNPYRSLVADFSRRLQAESSPADAPVILTFDKRANQYRHYTTLPVIPAIPRIGSPNGVLATYLSALRWNHKKIYVIWEMSSGEPYVPPSPESLFFPGNGEWKKIAESYTTRKRDKKRCLYCYTFTDEVRKKIAETPPQFCVEQFPLGEMEQKSYIPPAYCEELGQKREIPFFQKNAKIYPAGIELWIHLYWQPQSDSKIFLDERDVISGKSSLHCASRSPIRWFTAKWIPIQDIAVSFDAKCEKNAPFQLVVNGQWEGGFYQRELLPGELLTGNGKPEHYTFHLTRDFLEPADTVKIGFYLSQGDCIVDNFSIKTSSRNRK